MVPSARHGKSKARINFLIARPHWRVSRRSAAVRRHLDHHGFITPNFSWAEMADTRGVPVPGSLRGNAIRHCWNLERFSVAMAKKGRTKRKRIAIRIDGPYRTPQHNRDIGGASLSRHMSADASDHFLDQVNGWIRATGLSRSRIIAIARRYFTAVGNETSGTLHLDSRPGKAGSVNFVTW